MTDLTDQDVLHRLGGAEARDALAELVRRYGGLVYSAALRQVRDRHLAEDITQAVFIVLVRKAHSIRPNAVLAAWFFTVTRHASQNALRIERRRRYHETKKAATMRDEYLPAEVAEQGKHSLLIEAIAKLQQTDRSVIVLRYFQNRSHREIAEALAVSEEAARKRLIRALEKMRSFLEWRGVSDAESALSAGLAQSSLAELVPPALMSSIVNVALISHTMAPSASVLSIAKGAARMMTFTPQVKAAMIAVGVLGILGLAVVPMLKSAPTSPAASPSASLPTSQPAVNSVAVAAAPDDLNDLIAVASDQIKVHVLAVSAYPGSAGSWWSASGTPMSQPNINIPQKGFVGSPQITHQVVLRIEKPDSVLARCYVTNAVSMLGGSDGALFSPVNGGRANSDIEVIAFGPPPVANGPQPGVNAPQADAKTATLDVLISETDWQTVVTDDKPGEAGDFDTKDYGKINIQAVTELNPLSSGPNPVRLPGKKLSTVIVTHGTSWDPMQTVVVDDVGKIHHSVSESETLVDGQLKYSDGFDLPLGSVKQVLFQVRRFDKKLEVTDISLVPGQITNPHATVSDVSPEDQLNQVRDQPIIDSHKSDHH